MDQGRQLIQKFKAILRRSGLQDIRFHNLRHTYASLLIDQGGHPKYILPKMGHSSINITMDTYGHLINTVNWEASNRLDRAIFGQSLGSENRNPSFTESI